MRKTVIKIIETPCYELNPVLVSWASTGYYQLFRLD